MAQNNTKTIRISKSNVWPCRCSRALRSTPPTHTHTHTHIQNHTPGDIASIDHMSNPTSVRGSFVLRTHRGMRRQGRGHAQAREGACAGKGGGASASGRSFELKRANRIRTATQPTTKMASWCNLSGPPRERFRLIARDRMRADLTVDSRPCSQC